MEGNRRYWLKLLAIGLVFAFGLSACQHTTRMNTTPEGAEIYVNGIPIGETPVTYKSRSGFPQTYYVKIEKEGYKTLKDITIESQYRADESLVLLILGIVPYFFSARLEDQYIWHLIPEEKEQGSAALAPDSAVRPGLFPAEVKELGAPPEPAPVPVVPPLK